MKTKVKLYGKLAKLFREEYEFFNINAGTNIASAINSVSPKFKNQIIKDQSEGIHYEILINGETVNSKEEFFLNQQIKTVEVVPIVLGAGFAIALGTAMAYGGIVGIGTGFFAAGALGATMLFTFGVGLALAGLVYMMSAPDAIDPVDQEAAVKGESYYFSTTRNVASQGSPVPLGYGTLRCGSKVVGNTIRNVDVDAEALPQSTSRTSSKGGSTKARLSLAASNVFGLNIRPKIIEGTRVRESADLNQTQRFIEAFGATSDSRPTQQSTNTSGYGINWDAR